MRPVQHREQQDERWLDLLLVLPEQRNEQSTGYPA